MAHVGSLLTRDPPSVMPALVAGMTEFAVGRRGGSIASAAARRSGGRRGSGGRAACPRCRSPSAADPNRLGSSSVPTLTTMAGTLRGRVIRCVPHSAQNSRVTGFSRSLRMNVFGVPLVYLKPSGGMRTNMFGAPPLMYWHSRQWHCAFASARLRPRSAPPRSSIRLRASWHPPDRYLCHPRACPEDPLNSKRRSPRMDGWSGQARPTTLK